MVSLERTLKELEEFRDNRAKNCSNESEILNRLKQRIINGESTGDEIKDFAIIYFNADNSFENDFRELNNNLKSNDNGLVLVEEFYSKLIIKGEEGCFGGGDLTKQSAVLTLGRIKSPYLVLPKIKTVNSENEDKYNLLNSISSSFDISTERKFVFSGFGIYSDNFVLIKNEPSFSKDENINLKLYAYFMNATSGFIEGNGLSLGTKDNLGDLRKFSIIVGDEAVDKYFKKTHLIDSSNTKKESDGVYEKFRTLLKEDSKLETYLQIIGEIKENERQKNIKNLALDLLYKNQLYLSHYDAINKELVSREERADRRAGRITFRDEVTAYEEIKRDFIDNMNIISIIPKSELKDLANKIKYKIKEAKELGMDKLDKTIEVPRELGVSINISYLVNGLEKMYKDC